MIFTLVLGPVLPTNPIQAVEENSKDTISNARLIDERGSEVTDQTYNEHSQFYLSIDWTYIEDGIVEYTLPSHIMTEETEVPLIFAEKEIGQLTSAENALYFEFSENNNIEDATGTVDIPVTIIESEDKKVTVDLANLNIDRIYDVNFKQKEKEAEKEVAEETTTSDKQEKNLQLNEEQQSKPQAQVKEGTQNIRLSLKGSNSKSIFPNETYMATVNVHVSGDGVQLEEPYVLLEMNHDMIEDVTKSMDKPSRVKSMEFKRDEENNKTYVKIIFNPLRGGEDFAFDVPIKIDNATGTFPENYATTITAAIYDQDGDKVTDAKDKDELRFKTKYNRHRVEKKVDGSAADGQTVFGGLWDEKKGKFSPASIVTYEYGLDYTQLGTSYRNNFRVYDQVDIIDILPEGAYFDPNLNPGWEQIDNGTKVKYTLTYEDIGGGVINRWFEEAFEQVELHLSYPNGKDGEQIKNTVEAIFHQKDREEISEKFGGHKEPDHTDDDKINHTLTAYESGNSYKKAGSTYAFGTDEYEQFRQIKDFIGDKRETHTWYYGYRNIYPGTIKNFEIVDYMHAPRKDSDEKVISLDERLRFTAVNLTDEFQAGNVRIVEKYIDEDGTTEEVTSTDGIYDLGNDAVGFRILLKEVEQTERVRFSVDSVMDDYENVRYQEYESNKKESTEVEANSNGTDHVDFDNPNHLKNTVQYSGEVKLGTNNEHKFSQQNTQSFVLTKQDESIKVVKASNNSNKVYKTGEIVSFHLRIFYKDIDLDREFRNLKVVDLLPLGLDPVEPDFRGTGTMNTIKNLQNRGVYDYEIVENYANSGRTAYVFEFDNKTVRELIELYPQVGGNERDPFFNVPVQFKVNSLSNVADNRTNEMYLVYDGEQLDITEGSSRKKDHLDLRNNGDREEIIPGSDRTYLYAEEQLVEAHKYIKPDNTDSWGLVSKTPVGEGFQYRLQVVNNTRESIDTLTFFDKFPHEGDTYIAPNQAGNYGKRGSQFANELTGPVKVDHDGLVVYYSTKEPVNGDQTDYIREEENWVTEAELDEKFSDVKAIKVVLEDGKIGAGTEVNAYVPMITPEFLDEDYVAINTFAYSRDGGNRIDEASAVRNSTYVDTLDVTVDKEWLGGSSDRPTIEVQLKRNGKVIETQELDGTEGWSHTWKDLERTDTYGKEYEYTVDEVPLENYEPDFTGNITDGYLIVNSELITISGEKFWLDDHNEMNRPPAITVELYADGEKIAEQIANKVDNWKFTFNDLPKYTEDDEEIEYMIKEANVPFGYESKVEANDITNLRVEQTTISGQKTWLDYDKADRPKSITVNLLANGEKIAEQTVTAETDWTYTFENINVYDEEGKEITYTIEEEEVEGYASSVEGFDLTNVRDGTTEVTIKKIWHDDASDTAMRPEEGVKVNILQNGDYYGTYPVTEEDDWEVIVKDLPAFDEAGQPYTYTINEHDVPGYAAIFEDTNVTNTRYEKKDLMITKTWFDDAAEDRPEKIEFKLYRTPIKDNEKAGETTYVDTYTISEANDWQLEIKDVDKFDKAGLPYLYEVEEVDVPGYRTDIHGFEIVNTRVDTTEVSGQKAWYDEDESDRPALITVHLLANGEQEATQEVTAEDDWKYVFPDLEKYDERGKKITYTVEEEPVEGYESFVDGFNLINIRTGTTSIDITKNWQDEENTSLRPETIYVNLFQNGNFYKTYEITEADDWKLTVEDLPAFDEKGQVYEYTITERDIPGYATTYDNYTITNTRADEKDITITKSWLDDEAEDRPDEIEVTLYRSVTGGEKEKVGKHKLSEVDDWKLTITELEAFNDEGLPYIYEVEEDEVEGYASLIAGLDIVNIRVGATEVSGTKTWIDSEEADRPSSITIELRQNGETIDETTISESDDWTYEFTELPKFDYNGVLYEYTVEELVVDGYETHYEQTANGIDITNVEMTTVDVTKTWKDDKSDERPETITVNLLQNGIVIETADITKSDDWQYTFGDLPKYNIEGKEYEYTISEQDVPGYEAAVDGFDITNTRVDEKDITITKAWENDKSGDRPEKIEVELYRTTEVNEREKVDTYELTEADDWTLTIEKLAAFNENGQAYSYEIEEVPVEGYETEIHGFDITNTWIDEEEPEKEDDPSRSEESGKKEEDQDKEDPTKAEDESIITSILPKTATQLFSLIAAGIGLLGLGITINILRKRKEI